MNRFLLLALPIVAGGCLGTLPSPEGYEPSPTVEGAEERRVAAGVLHRVDSGHGSTVNVLVIDPRYAGIEAAKGGDNLFATASVPAIANAASGRHGRALVAAVNADFYEPNGAPTGMLVAEEMIWRGPWRSEDGNRTRSVFAVDAEGGAFMGLPEFAIVLVGPEGQEFTIGGVNIAEHDPVSMAYTWPIGEWPEPAPGSHRAMLRLSDSRVSTHGRWVPNEPAMVEVDWVNQPREPLRIQRNLVLLESREPLPEWIIADAQLELRATLADAGASVETVSGGLPRLIDDGMAAPDAHAEQEAFPARVVDSTHPRTAVGILPDGKIVLMTADGRSLINRGMTLPELAGYLEEMGCVEALNLDGGGSTMMWVRGELVNNPSNAGLAGSLRAVGTALLVVER